MQFWNTLKTQYQGTLLSGYGEIFLGDYQLNFQSTSLLNTQGCCFLRTIVTFSPQTNFQQTLIIPQLNFQRGKIPRTKCIYFLGNFHCNKLPVAFLLLGEVKVVSHSCQGIVMQVEQYSFARLKVKTFSLQNKIKFQQELL